MKLFRRGLAVLALTAPAMACAPLTPPNAPAAAKPLASAIVREDLSGRFIALIGPKAQHDPPYLGTPQTNFFCLRSFIDRRTGETAHQLYVAASYDGKRDWDAAHDGAGQPLVFIPISRQEIVCGSKNNCSYAEEFAAKIAESELRASPRGLSVVFTDTAGDSQLIQISAEQIAAQLAALKAHRNEAPPSGATRAAPPAGDHQPE